MKKIYLLFVLLQISINLRGADLNSNNKINYRLICSKSGINVKTDTPKNNHPNTAYYDAKRIDSLLNLSVSDINDSIITVTVYRYLKNFKGDKTALIQSSFDERVFQAINRYTPKVDIEKIANHISNNWGKLFQQKNKSTSVPSKLAFDDTIKSFQKTKIEFERLKDELLLKYDFNNKVNILDKTAELNNLDSLKKNLSSDTSQNKSLLNKNGFKNSKDFNDKISLLNDYTFKFTLLNKISQLLNVQKKYLYDPYRQSSVIKEDYLQYLSKNKPTDLQSIKIYDYISSNNINSNTTSGASTNSSTNNPNQTATLTNFKIPSQSQLIDGLAIYIVNRFKQDGILTFISTLRKYAVKQPLLTEMFPNTFSLLNEYPDYETPRFGKLWSHAIAEDLSTMPENILNSTVVNKFLKSKLTVEELKYYNLFSDVVLIAKQVALKSSMPAIVDYFYLDSTSLKNPYIVQAFKVFKMINNEFINGESKEKYWLEWNKLSTLSEDEQKIFLGLITNKYPDLFQSKYSIKVNNNGKTINFISKILLILNSYQADQISYLAKITKDPATIYTGTNFWDLQLNLIKVALDIDVLKLPIGINTGNFTKEKDHYLNIASKCINIYKNLESKDYGAMIHESISVLDSILEKKQFAYSNMLFKNWNVGKEKYQATFNKIKPQLDIIEHQLNDKKTPLDIVLIKNEVEELFVNLADTDDVKHLLVLGADYNNEVYKNIFQEVIKTLNKGEIVTKSVNLHPQKNDFYYIAKFSSFFTDLLTAQKSEEIATVIGTYAAAPNSYKIKRGARESICLNSFVGTYFGTEFTPDTKPVFGLSAPVGLSINWGIHKKVANYIDEETFIARDGKLKKLTGESLSLNISIIDIGAVVSYRLNNGNDGALPKSVNFGQVLAPGLSLSYGFRDVPLCFNIGAQLTPQLRNLNDSNLQQSAFRVYAGLFYDLPLAFLTKR